MLVALLALFAVLIPLGESDWVLVSFDKAAPNHVDFGESLLKITVDDSASALLGKIAPGTRVTRLVISGRVEGRLNLPSGSVWEEGFDDSILRVGLIERGERKLSRLQSALAPDWLRQVEAQFRDSGDGVGMIRSLLLMPESTLVGKTRINPGAKMFHERIVAAPEEDGTFRMMAEFDPPVDAIGLWLQADGDDTDSSFAVVVEELSITREGE